MSKASTNMGYHLGYYLYRDQQSLLFILLTVTVAIVSGNLTYLGLCSILILYILYFYRKPIAYPFQDSSRSEPDTFISPCSGKILRIDTYDSKTRVVVFMGLLDEHVQISPCDGIVTNLTHVPGSLAPAGWITKSDKNEHLIIRLNTQNGNKITLVIFAGCLARRIETLVKIGDSIKQYSPIALVKLGSRCDIIFEDNSFDVSLKVGQYLRLGETIARKNTNVKQQENQS